MMFGHVQPLSLGLGTRAQVPGWGRKCRAAQTSVSLSSVPVQAERRSQQHPRLGCAPVQAAFYSCDHQLKSVHRHLVKILFERKSLELPKRTSLVQLLVGSRSGQCHSLGCRAPSTTLSRPPSTGFYDAQPQHTHAQEAAVALLVVEGLKLLLNGQAKLPQG